MTQRSEFEAAPHKVYFVIAFRDDGQQAPLSGAYANQRRAYEIAQANARIDRKPAYVVGVDVTSIMEVRP